MVHFKMGKSQQTSKKYLVTFDNASDGADAEVKHTIFPPITGSFAERWLSMTFPSNLDCWWQGTENSAPVLRSSHHRDSNVVPKSSKLLHYRLSKGEAQLVDNFHFGSEFHYIPRYWEWLEDILRECRGDLISVYIYEAVYASLFLYERSDQIVESFCNFWCPETNTLLTAAGEVSISLWDIRSIAGLPVTGVFYDEVVPSSEELNGFDESGHPYLPPSCKHLFSAFHRISLSAKKNGKVSFKDWCHFWFNGTSKYFLSSNASEKAHLPTPRSDSSSYGEPTQWDENTHDFFLTLGVPKTERRQTYLAAFISCWLCAFVLPVRDLGNIRASVFKVSSLLASNKMVSLAIPVLASIYRGLNDISTSATPGKDHGHFAAHYVYAWLAKYYRSHKSANHSLVLGTMIEFQGKDAAKKFRFTEAKRQIWSGNQVSWLSTFRGDKEEKSYKDDNRNMRRTTDFLIASRSSFLTLRHNDDYIVEPYSPHRFARQLGFQQDVPGVLIHDIRGGSLERVFQLFQTSICLGTNSKFIIPRESLKIGTSVTPAYASWLKGISKLTIPNETRRSSKSPDDHASDGMAEVAKEGLETVTSQGELELVIVQCLPSENSSFNSTKNLEKTSKRSLKLKLGQSSTQQPSDLVIPPPKKKVKLVHRSIDQPSTVSTKVKLTSGPAHSSIDKTIPPPDANFTSTRSLGDEGEPSIQHILDDIPEADDFPSIDEDSVLKASTLTDLSDFQIELYPASPTDRAILDAILGPTEEVSFEHVILEAERKAYLSVADALQTKLLGAPLAQIPAYEKECETVINYLKTKNVDVSVFQADVQNYLSSAKQLHSLGNNYTMDHPPPSHFDEKIKDIDAQISTATSLGEQAKEEAETLRGNLQEAMSKTAQLKKEIKEMEVTTQRIVESIAAAAKKDVDQALVVQTLTQKRFSLKTSMATAEQEAGKIEHAEETFTKASVTLKDFQGFP